MVRYVALYRRGGICVAVPSSAKNMPYVNYLVEAYTMDVAASQADLEGRRILSDRVNGRHPCVLDDERLSRQRYPRHTMFVTEQEQSYRCSGRVDHYRVIDGKTSVTADVK